MTAKRPTWAKIGIVAIFEPAWKGQPFAQNQELSRQKLRLNLPGLSHGVLLVIR